MSKIAVVIGAGPGLGGSLAKKFAQEGMKVACVRRDADKAKEAAASIGEHAVAFPADASNADEVEKLFKAIDSKWKDAKLDLVVFNAGTFAPGGLLETAPEEFERCWRVGAFAGFLVAQQALKRFVEKGSGTLIFTGATASLRGGARFQNLASPKFALRSLAQSIAREFGPKGIHCAHVIVDGQINIPGRDHGDREEDTMLAPDEMANTYWNLYQQHKTTWTQELDLRPYCEKF